MDLRMAFPLRNNCAKLAFSNIWSLHFGRSIHESSVPRSVPKMRFVQFLRKNDNRKRLGVVSDDGKNVTEISGGACVSNDMVSFICNNISLQEIQRKFDGGKTEEMSDSHVLLPPLVNPPKIICIGLNYKDHCIEQNKPAPSEPIFFSKLITSLTGPTGDIIAHKITTKIDWEVELGVVIGKVAKKVPKELAMDHVFGYTIAQDITARDWQRSRNGGQFFIGKSMDTFLPLGPAIVHKSLIRDVYDLNMRTIINGVEKQNNFTGDMIFKIDDIIHRLSQCITLKPGDLILTGTPKGVGVYRDPPEYLKVGDIVESEIQCLGKMKNKVVADNSN